MSADWDDPETFDDMAAVHDETRQMLAAAKELLGGLPADQKVEIATEILPSFTRLLGAYSDFCAFLRALQIGADGAA